MYILNSPKEILFLNQREENKLKPVKEQFTSHILILLFKTIFNLRYLYFTFYMDAVHGED